MPGKVKTCPCRHQIPIILGNSERQYSIVNEERSCCRHIYSPLDNVRTHRLQQQQQQQRSNQMLGWLNKGPQTLPECPEPRTKEEYVALAAKTLNRVLSIIDSDGWDEIPITKRSGSSNDDTRLFAKQSTDPSEGSSHLLKTTGTIACSPSALYRAISSGDVEERQKWEKDLLELRTVEGFFLQSSNILCNLRSTSLLYSSSSCFFRGHEGHSRNLHCISSSVSRSEQVQAE